MRSLRDEPLTLRHRVFRWMAGILFLAVYVPSPLQAHPFGSRYFAHQTKLMLEPQQVSIEYLIEIPTTVILKEFYLALGGRPPTAEEDATYTRDKITKLLEGLQLRVDGALLEWNNTTDTTERNGVGNVNFFIYHLTASMSWSPVAGRPYQVTLSNGNYPAGEAFYHQELWAPDGLDIVRASLWDVRAGQAATDGAGAWTSDARARDLDLTVRLVGDGVSGGALALRKTAPNYRNDTLGSRQDGRSQGADNYYVPSVDGVPLQSYLARAELNPLMVIVALGLAIFFGAAHALSPGHGKTLVAAYLVGSRGTVRHAILLGLAVTFSHTASVVLLGIVTLFASQYILPEVLFPYIEGISGLAIVLIGLWMIRARWRLRKTPLRERVAEVGGFHNDRADEHCRCAHRREHEHGHEHECHEHEHDDHGHEHGHCEHDDHEHGCHTHEHGHEHEHECREHECHAHVHGHAHAHSSLHLHWGGEHEHEHGPLEPDVTFGQLIRFGIAGGIVPCPTAMVVLLSAIALHRVAFGLALVLAFSVGLAAVLVVIGILMVMAGSLLRRISGSGRLVRYLPVASAVLVTGLGIAILVNAWIGGGDVLAIGGI